MLTLVFATALAAAPAPAPMSCAGCAPMAMADCPMGPQAMGGMRAPAARPHLQQDVDRR